MRTSNTRERDKKKKRSQSDFEKMIFLIVEKSLNSALKAALDDVFKDFKGGSININL